MIINYLLNYNLLQVILKKLKGSAVFYQLPLILL